ncbi:MAG: hypothetical protein ABFD58_10165 [Anaerolineaceae bacterium]
MTAMIDAIRQALSNYGGKWGEKKGLWDFSATIAERKAFLSKKQLTYTCKMRIDDGNRTVRFSEVLIEAGSGLSTGGGFDSDMSSGFGVKKETYNTFGGTRQGTIEEQSSLFGKDYTYQFNYQEIREKIKAIVENAGYRFEYQILPVK